MMTTTISISMTFSQFLESNFNQIKKISLSKMRAISFFVHIMKITMYRRHFDIWVMIDLMSMCVQTP